MTDACLPRSPEALHAAVAAVDPEHTAALKAHDVDGDGKPETFCNVALALMLAQLGLLLPKGLTATYQGHWLDSAAGRAMGWEQCTVGRAMWHASQGLPVVAFWENTTGPHSHVALLVPTPPGAMEPHIAQAGGSNFNDGPLSRGFGRYVPRYFFHA